VASAITRRASAFAAIDEVLTSEPGWAEALAAQLAAAMCEAERSAWQRGVWSAETEQLRLSLREAVRRTRLAWRTAQRRLPGLPSIDLTTAAGAAIGSGKTRPMCRSARRRHRHRVPVLALDPKGDLANMALVFPELVPDAFRPWTPDPESAART
jgi:hypothetical protein